MINAAIEDEKLKYSLPVYSLNYIKENNNNSQFCKDSNPTRKGPISRYPSLGEQC